MTEGYITAKVIVEAVRHQGSRPTREGMSAMLDAMDSYDRGAYAAGFKPGIRSGSIISGTGKIRQ